MNEPPPVSAPRVSPGVLVAVCVVVGLVAGVLGPRALTAYRTEQLLDDLTDSAKKTAAYLRLLDLRGRAVPALLGRLDDEGYAARGDALELLGRSGDRRALARILALNEPALAHDRLVALGNLGGPEAQRELVAALERALAPGGDLSLAFPALKALGDWPELPGAITVRFLPLLEHEQWGLRELAARGLGSQGYAAAEPALIALLRDPNLSVRQGAAWSLERLGTPTAVDAVAKALDAGLIPPEEN